MEALMGIFSAFGLSASAGLNAYIPLLVVAILARSTHLITLSSPWAAFSSAATRIALPATFRLSES